MSEKVKNKNGLLGIALKILLNIVIFLVCLIAFVLILYVFSAQIHKNDKTYKPFLSFYTIVSPSMNPVIKVYDVVVNTKVNKQEDIEVGDIITYISTNSTSEGMTITHRVVAISKAENGAYEYQTQGDNNSEPDGVLVTFDNVIGKEIFVIPKLGRIQFLLANRKGWFILLLIPILIFVLKDIYDLIELLGLRRKVDDVSGYIEESSLVKNRKEKERRETEKKDIFKRELSIHAIKQDALVRKETEGVGFLEPYTESVIEVGKVVVAKEDNKEVEPIKIVKADNIVGGKEIIADTDNNELNEQISKIKPIYSSIEILDSDELTKRIKDYNEKIAELDNMLNDLKQLKIDKEKEMIVEKERLNEEIALEKQEARKEIEEEINRAKKEIKTNEEKKEKKKDPKKIVDNYLIGRKIKVVGSVDAKKRKNNKNKDDKKIVLGNKNENNNSRLVIEKPKAEDLPKMNIVNEETPKSSTIIEKRNLNIKDNIVRKKKVTSNDVILKELNTINKKSDSDLLFNPKVIKKVETNKKVVKEKKKKVKGKFIYIVKETKDKKGEISDLH